MTGERLDGRRIAKQIRAQLEVDVEILNREHGLVPGLGVILVGDDPASLSYVRAKTEASRLLGIKSEQRNFPSDTDTKKLLEEVSKFNNDSNIHGILVQLPLPNQDEQRVINAISPEKDVDGLHPINLGCLMRGEEGFWPCTPYGVIEIIRRCDFRVEGAHAVVVGRSNLVGRPIANLLAQKMEGANATVTLCHTGTRDLGKITRQADILVVAMGQPLAISADMVKEGSIVIDVGVNRVDDDTRERGWRLVGDVDYLPVKKRVRAITPVPNGVGPMTITMLINNVVLAAKRQAGLYNL